MGYKLKRITIRQDTSWHPGANTIAYYEFEQNLNDSSGNGNTATGTGIGYTLVDGQYVVTNTTSTGYINLPNGLGTNIGSGDFTLSFWLYPVTPGGTSDGVLLFGVSSSTTPYYGPNIYFDYYWNKRVTFRLSKENSDRLDLLDIDDSLIGAWHHFVMTRNSGVVSCYIDTTLKGTFNSSVTVPSSTETNVLFARGTDAQAWYNTGAKMDKVILESVGWTATEVSNYYNKTKGNYGYTPEPTLIEKQIRPKLIPATAITLNESLINMKTIGDTYQLVATLTPADSTSSVTWSSDDTSIATVDNTGLVTCVTPGECTITAETDNGLTASCSVTNKWTPGANTLAYYPLNSTTTVNDMSSNSRNLTKEDPYGNVHFGTYDNVDCCYMNGGRFNYASMPSIVSGTILLYVNTHSASNNTNTAIINRQFNSTYSYWALKLYASGTYLEYVYPTALNNIGTYGTSNTTATWMLLTIVKDNGSYKVYKNGVLLSTKNGYGGSSNTNFYIGQDGQNGSYYFNGSISNVIIEDKVWTASEIQDYFNNTKSIYGIS